MTTTQILAATFTIAFEGLMLFQGPSASEKKDVVIVTAEEHNDPKIEIFKIEDGKMVQIGDKTTIKQGDKISFNLRSGTADTDSRFNKYVPTLDDYIRFGNVHDDVVNAKLDYPATLAVVELPKGYLTVYRTFPEQVRLTRFLPDTRCFPRYVLHETLTAEDVTLTITRKPVPLELTIPKDGLVIISNGSAKEGAHFHEYRRLLGSVAWLGSSTILKDTKCVEPTTEEPTALSNQVALAKLKDLARRLPNGDCGPVDNP